MSFTPVSRKEVGKDLLNIHAVAAIPEVLVAEHNRWQKLGQTGQPESQSRSFAHFFGQRTTEAALLTVHATRALRLGYPNQGEILQSFRDVAASMALGRLISYYLTEDQSFTEGGDTLAPTAEGKFLVDYHEDQPLNNAYGVIVHENRLEHAPFEGQPQFRNGQAWYVNQEDGLYVAARQPAIATPMLLDELAMSVGSLENAQAIVDAEHSVTLQPYFSIGYIAATNGYSN